MENRSPCVGRGKQCADHQDSLAGSCQQDHPESAMLRRNAGLKEWPSAKLTKSIMNTKFVLFMPLDSWSKRAILLRETGH